MEWQLQDQRWYILSDIIRDKIPSEMDHSHIPFQILYMKTVLFILNHKG